MKAIKQMTLIYWVVLMTIVSCTSGMKQKKDFCTFSKNVADCSNKGLDSIPHHFSKPFQLLDLSNNNIRHITSNAFVFAPNLTYLSLRSNNIDTIERDGFFGLALLTGLDISYNNLQQIPDSFFSNLRHLCGLAVAYNNFGYAQAELAKNLTSFASLQNLSMDIVPGFQFPSEFSHLSNLSYLRLCLVQPSFHKLLYTRDTFRHLESLKISYLWISCVTTITNDTFYYLHSLDTLIVDICKKVRVSPVNDIFSSFASFEGRNMSEIQLNFNTFKFAFTLRTKHIRNMEKICLKRFSLNNMYIKSIEINLVQEMARHFTCLEYLEISRNVMINQSPYGMLFLQYFKRLKILKIQDVFRYYDRVSREVRPFQSLEIISPPTLEEVYLRRMGEYDCLPNVTVRNGANLRVLSLPDIQLGNCLGSINGAANVIFFDMSGWNCSLISENLLSSLPKLETFNASRASIGIGFKNNLKTSTLFRNNHLLKTIDISYNGITTLPHDLFLSNFQQLSLVNISHNYLTTFPKFQTETKSLQMIDLTFNRITTFTDEDLEMIRKLGTVKILLSNNPLQCSCMAVKFLKWLKESQQIDDISFILCYLNDGRQTNISDISLKSFEILCVTKFWLIFSAVLISLLTLCILITVVRVRYKYAIQYFLLRAKLWWKRQPEEDIDYKYDAFICCCQQDNVWVKQLYIKMSEMGLKLCISFKDFLAGVEIAENILQAIDSSRKIVFIISCDFLKSDWCTFELEMARMHAFQQGRNDMVIVVLKENIAVEEMPNILRSIWFKVTCIKWPREDNVQPFNTQDIFYKSLKLALRQGSRNERPIDGIEFD